MSHPRMPDPARTALRAAVAAVDRALREPRAPEGSSEQETWASSLDAAWNDLVALLALGPEPEYRQCPTCGALAMLDATVCGYCWTELTPDGRISVVGVPL